MVLFNYSTRELTAKIVYYGPGLCGKTTNLQYIHSTLPDNVRGKMLSLATKTDRTLFFDFLPIDLGQIRGMKTRVQLYTVPGQVFYNETRKLVLKGADGIVFVADSQATMLGANIESFKNLEENLKAHGMTLSEMPHVLQFNKRDLPKLASIEELNAAINRFNSPFYESVATTGIGVQDTLKAITKLVLLHLTRKYDPKATAPGAATRSSQVAVSGAPLMEPDPPAAAPAAPSPSATMQMPSIGSGPGGGGTIPLSEAAASPADAGADLGGTFDLGQDPSSGVSFDEPPAVAPPSPVSVETAFADQEIQDLVDEVQETENLEPAFGDLGVGAGETTETWDLGPSVEPSMDAIEASVPPSPLPSNDPPVAAVPPAVDGPSVEAAPSTEGKPVFEIDHGLDPEWPAIGSTPPAMPTESVPEIPDVESPSPSMETTQSWDLGAIDAPATEPSVEHPLTDLDLPKLTEVVADHELFDPNALDIARLSEGQEREIVVPVEVEHADQSVRRYKLCIRLRMDPIQ